MVLQRGGALSVERGEREQHASKILRFWKSVPLTEVQPSVQCGSLGEKQGGGPEADNLV